MFTNSCGLTLSWKKMKLQCWSSSRIWWIVWWSSVQFVMKVWLWNFHCSVGNVQNTQRLQEQMMNDHGTELCTGYQGETLMTDCVYLLSNSLHTPCCLVQQMPGHNAGGYCMYCCICMLFGWYFFKPCDLMCVHVHSLNISFFVQ